MRASLEFQEMNLSSCSSQAEQWLEEGGKTCLCQQKLVVIVIYLSGLKKHPYLTLATESPSYYLAFHTLLYRSLGPFNK